MADLTELAGKIDRYRHAEFCKSMEKFLKRSTEISDLNQRNADGKQKQKTN